MDYLTKPSFFEDFGFSEKVKMADRVKVEDELFLVAYPYFNVNGSFNYPISFKCAISFISGVSCISEMLVVEELYKEAVENTNRKLIIFNGELDRIRSGCILFSSLHRSSIFFILNLYTDYFLFGGRKITIF